MGIRTIGGISLENQKNASSEKEPPIRSYHRPLLLFLVSCTVLLIAGCLSIIQGAFPIPLEALLQERFLKSSHPTHAFVIWDLRMPRVLVGAFVGAALGMAGAIVQAITRNPLGSPSLTGVTSGAALTIVIGYVFLQLGMGSALLLGTMGGFLSAMLTFTIAWKTALNPIHVTLAGICVSIFCASAIMIVMLLSEREANSLYFWLVGGLINRTWLEFELLWGWVVLGLFLGTLFSRQLNILLLDDAVATSLGLPIMKWRLILGIIAVVLTAASVAAAGPIGFVGLIVPHIVRYFLGFEHGAADYRIVLPCSAVVGSALLVTGDAIAKVYEIPVGILSVAVGGPLFVYLIHKRTEAL